MKPLARMIVLGGLGLFALACTEAPTTPSKDVVVPINDPLFAFNNAGQCFGDDAVDFQNLVSGMGDDPEDVGCTSNDIDIAIATGVPQGGQPGDAVMCTPGQNVTLDLTAFFDQNAESDREDIGVWVATDGGTAVSGACNHYYFETNPDGSIAVPGTFNEDLDQCAGMAEQATASLSLGTLTIPCNIVTVDPDGNGSEFELGSYLQVGACIGWKIPGANNTSPVCADNADGVGGSGTPNDFRAGTLLANKAKCNCDPFYVPVILPGNITIIKDAIPNDAQDFAYTTTGDGMSNFSLDDDADPTLSTTKNFTNLDPTVLTPRTVTETVPAGWTISNIVCSGDDESTVLIGADSDFDAGDNSVSILVAEGETVSCTFENTKDASIDIEKISLGGVGQFDYVETGPCIPSNFSRTTTTAGVATTTAAYDCAPPFTTDQYVQETVPAGWTLTNISCSGTATIVVGSGGSGAFVAGATNNFDAGDNTVKITPAAGAAAACTFTNTKHGSITIVKDAQSPATDDEDFAFTATGTGVNNFTLDDDGGSDNTNSNQIVFSDLLPGTRTFTEGAETNWDLTNISCTGQTTSTIAFVGGNADPAFQFGDNQASVGLAAGESVTCTFVNKRLARLIVLKVLLGGGTQSFNFSRSPGGLLFSLLDGQSNNSGFSLAPNTYTVCELSLAVAWFTTATIDNVAATLLNLDFPLDLGNRCVQVTLAYGDSRTVAFINTPPPGGDARTIGYWKNWSSCAQSNGKQYEKAVAAGNFDKTLDGNLPQTIGNLTLAAEDCEEAVLILDKSDIVSGKKKASDPAYNLAAQLLAAKLNITAGAGTCAAANTAITDAQTLLVAINFTGTGNYANTMTAAQKTQANTLAGILDSYNNNTLCP